MDFKELAAKYGVTEDNLDAFLAELKANKIYFSAEENMDVRYPKLKADNDANIAKLNEANRLIAEMKKSQKGNEDLQTKVKEYEDKIAELDEENERLKVESATKVALLKAGGEDIDYLIYKLKQDKELKLNEDGTVDGLESMIDAMKVSMPNQFKGSQTKKIDENKLDDKKNPGVSITKEEFNKMTYAQRNELFKTNREAYDELSKH